MKKEGSGQGSQDHFSIVRFYLIKLCAVILISVHPSDSQEKAARKLIEAIENGKISTPGYFRGWCKRLWYLPSNLKMRVWLSLAERIDKNDWAELRHKNAEIEEELQKDLETRLEHIAELKR